MKKGSEHMMFAHSPDGVPLSIVYDDLLYYYVTNIQGDVVAILDATGAEVVTYTYDAWGNILTIGGSKATTLGQDNPLRYRGYVYDQETGLYYLQSRYYDPEMGRFISADSFTSTGQGFAGNNMFAYCLNNPVLFEDPSGYNAAVAALEWWTVGMSWLPVVDAVFPVGDAVYVGIIVVLGVLVLAEELEDSFDTVLENTSVSGGYSSPNNNDDDDDDDDGYYDDDSNFGGREKIGKNKGNAPRSNRAQNAQAKAAARRQVSRKDPVPYELRQEIHRSIGGQGYSFKETLDEIKHFGWPK